MSETENKIHQRKLNVIQFNVYTLESPGNVPMLVCKRWLLRSMIDLAHAESASLYFQNRLPTVNFYMAEQPCCLSSYIFPLHSNMLHTAKCLHRIWAIIYYDNEHRPAHYVTSKFLCRSTLCAGSVLGIPTCSNSTLLYT